MVVGEKNAILQNTYAEIINYICKANRGSVLEILVRECKYPAAMMVAIKDCAHRCNTSNLRAVTETYIETIDGIIWSIGVLCQDLYARDFLQLGIVEKVIEVI